MSKYWEGKIQEDLARLGFYRYKIDGDYGEKSYLATHAAMPEIEPVKSVIPLDFKGDAKRLDDIDLPRIAATIGAGEDELHAFMDVEASGSGFDIEGRPKMLFEPHVFYRNLTGVERNVAVKQGLAYRRWGEKKYPRDSYPRLIAAMKINETAALKAASWGLGQILGENYKLVGYDSPQEMVLNFMKDEEHHLQAIVDFLISNGIDDDLRDHNWHIVARVYNGPGYKKHNYHGRMAKAYAKWSKIRDTPYNGE